MWMLPNYADSHHRILSDVLWKGWHLRGVNHYFGLVKGIQDKMLLFLSIKVYFRECSLQDIIKNKADISVLSGHKW